MNDCPPIEVVAVVPLSIEAGGDELLVFQVDGALILPRGVALPGERLLEAAVRIVREQAGFTPVAPRLVYLLESVQGPILVGVLCQLPAEVDGDTELQGEFVSVTQSDLPLNPMALRETLVEDLRSGFVRAVAHVVENAATDGPLIEITW